MFGIILLCFLSFLFFSSIIVRSYNNNVIINVPGLITLHAAIQNSLPLFSSRSRDSPHFLASSPSSLFWFYAARGCWLCHGMQTGRLTKPPSTYILVLPFFPLLPRGPLAHAASSCSMTVCSSCILQLVFDGPLDLFLLSLSLSFLPFIPPWLWQPRYRQTIIVLFLIVHGVVTVQHLTNNKRLAVLANGRCYGEKWKRTKLYSVTFLRTEIFNSVNGVFFLYFFLFLFFTLVNAKRNIYFIIINYILYVLLDC